MRIPLLGLAGLAVLLANPQGTSGATNGNPDSMAALGDSITRAANASDLGDQPQYSWSTGDNSTVQSHYYRILQGNPAISGNNYNYAVSGAKMINLNSQAINVNSTPGGVEYVTILMGANDVCTSSEATMTSVTTFRSQFQQAMNTLTTGSPNARIFLASIPDIFRLWQILHTNSSAVLIWNAFGICQSMLANPTSTAQADVDRRSRVRQRNIDFNTQLAEVCALHAQCRFDGNAGFNYQFVESDVSTLDYFHPSIAGQTNGASATWAVSDPDGDGWTVAGEGYIGTDPLVACTPGGWPPDPLPAPDGNGTVGIDDVFFAASRFNASVGDGNYSARAEIASQDGTIAIDDVFAFASRFNQTCVS